MQFDVTLYRVSTAAPGSDIAFIRDERLSRGATAVLAYLARMLAEADGHIEVSEADVGRLFGAEPLEADHWFAELGAAKYISLFPDSSRTPAHSRQAAAVPANTVGNKSDRCTLSIGEKL